MYARMSLEPRASDRIVVDSIDLGTLGGVDLHTQLMRAPVAIAMWRGAEHTYVVANERYQQLVGKRELVGKTLRAAFPELVGSELFAMFDQVYRTGTPVVVHEMPVRFDRHGDGHVVDGWFAFNLDPVRDPDGSVTGLMAAAIEVTDQVLARRSTHVAEERLRLAVESADMGTWDFNPTTGELRWDARCKAIFGLAADAHVDYPMFLERLHPDDRARTDAAVQQALDPEGTGEYVVEYRVLAGDEERWVLARGRGIFEHERAVRFIGTTLDISERKRAELDLVAINRIAARLAAELDHEKLTQLVVDEATALCGARFGAYFYNVTDDKGESYMLWALSGARREEFARFGMPRNTKVFAPTFRGEGVVRADDITKDRRYGHNAPHHGMPAGHLPVKSYLAVPVYSRTGRVLGGLFFGHPEAGRFSARHEQLIAAVAAHAGIAFDNAQLYRAEQQAQAATRARVRQSQMAADVAIAFSEGGDLRAALQRCCQAAVDHLDAAFARIWTVAPDGAHLELQASAGMYTHIDGGHRLVPIGSFKIGLIAAERTPHLTNDVQHDPRVGDREWARREGLVSFAGYPLVVADRLVGVFALFARQRLSDVDVLPTLQSVANVISVGIERQRAEATAQLERARIRTMFAQAPAGIALLTGPKHFFESANAGYIELVGGREVLGKTVREAFPELASTGIYEILDRVYERGEPFVANELPIPLVRKGAPETVYVNFVYQPLPDAWGRTEAILVHAVEVTEMVRARQAIRDSEERYRFASNAVPNQVWTALPDGGLDWVNARVLEYFGKPAERLVGEGWADYVHPDDLPQAIERWRASLATGEPYQAEFRLLAADGSWHWHIARAEALRDERSAVVKWFGSNVDIHDRKEAERERERLIRALERSNQELDQFAYVASHDLKAPLRGIGNLSQWIEEDLGAAASDEAKGHLRLLRGRVMRMEALIDGILTYSRAARARDKVEPVDVGALVREVLELINPPATAKIEIVRPLPTAVLAERVQLQQIFLNLVGNALKHARRQDPVVQIGATDDGAAWHFTVADNGPGIAPEFHERIWGIFQTLEARDKVEGAGIGLAVVKKIIEWRGGRAWVDSRPGEGATFHVTWPKQQGNA